MATVAEIHAARRNVGGWVLFAEGSPYAWTTIRELAGSGASSWIGTAHGARTVLQGLVMPSELGLGETDPWAGAMIDAQPVTFGLKDLSGTGLLAQIFRESEPDLTTDSMGERLSPLDDPAPATIAGPNQTPIDLWDRFVGIEAIGPAGERRHYWIAPDDIPPGLDHVGGIGWPPAVITDSKTTWPGTKVAIYRIVKEHDSDTYPSWDDQYAGGSLWWYGTIKGRGTFRSTGGQRMFSLPCLGPSSWLRGSANILRPTKWHSPAAGVILEGDRAKVAAWIEVLPHHQVNDGIASIVGTWESQTLVSGNTFAGLTTREELAAKLDDIVQTMITGLDHGTVLGASNSVWTEPAPVADGLWGATAGRAVTISADGSTITIQSESPTAPNANRGYNIAIAMDATVWALFGFDLSGLALQREEFTRVGGQHWGELQGDQVTPPFHYTGTFSTRESVDQPSALWANGGDPKIHVADYPSGTVTLDHQGGDDLRLAVGVALAEGQLSQPYTFGAQLDGVDVDAAGWWIFSGKLLTAAAFLAGDDPIDTIQIARCEWVKTASGDGVEIDSQGFSRLRILENGWEDPHRFGFNHDRITEPWANVLGELRCAPMGLIGGTITAPDWRHRIIPRTLLSSGTAVFLEAGGEVTVTPGDNHPPELPPGDPWAGDVEVKDLGLGLPAAFVDALSWRDVAATLPGGSQGALNRVTYPLVGSAKIQDILIAAMGGSGLAWTSKRKAGGVVPAFGCFDPIATLTLEQVEVTLSRADMAEPMISETDEQWRGVVELRDSGPFDRFVYSVDGDPLRPGSSNYRLEHESQDVGRRYRDSAIEWPIKDRGLRDPSRWLGTGKAPLYDFEAQGRERFAIGYGQRYGKPARIYKNTYNATYTGLIGLGTIVHIIDSTAESPDGEIGINHLGWVREAAILSKGKGNTSIRVTVELQPRAVTELKVWSPQARGGVGSWDSGTSTLTVREDWAEVGGGHEDTIGFTQPASSSHAAGALRVAIYQSESGRDFPAPLEVRADVASVDDVAHTITLSSIVGTLYRDTIKVIVAAPKDEQTAEWALALYVPITEPSGLWDGVENGDRL
jgi:hypothetical protein